MGIFRRRKFRPGGEDRYMFDHGGRLNLLFAGNS